MGRIERLVDRVLAWWRGRVCDRHLEAERDAIVVRAIATMVEEAGKGLCTIDVRDRIVHEQRFFEARLALLADGPITVAPLSSYLMRVRGRSVVSPWGRSILVAYVDSEGRRRWTVHHHDAEGWVTGRRRAA